MAHESQPTSIRLVERQAVPRARHRRPDVRA